MLKKILSAFCMAILLFFVASNHVFAAKNIAVILDVPTGMFSEPEKTHATLMTSLNKILGDDEDYNILPIEEVSSYVQIYREENNLIKTVTTEGVAVESFLKKKDIDEICKHFGSDYVIYTRISTTKPKVVEGIFSVSRKVNVILDFRVWSDSKKDFSYIKRTTTTGSSTAIYAGVGSSSRALEKGLKKGLQEIEKDSSKVRAAMD